MSSLKKIFIKTTLSKKGEMPIPPENPIHENSEKYEFGGWSPDIHPVDGVLIYSAIWIDKNPGGGNGGNDNPDNPGGDTEDVITYGDWTVTLSVSPTSLTSAGGQITCTATATRDVFTNGIKTDTQTATPTITSNKGTVNGNKVTVSSTTSARTITITATYDGKTASKDVSLSAPTGGGGNNDDEDDPITYTIKYMGNGSTSGTMTDDTKELGKDYTVKTNAYSKTGYTFSKWNTKADGSGTSYYENSTYKLDKDITFYALWTQVVLKNTYTLHYDANGGSPNPTDVVVESDADSYTFNIDKPAPVNSKPNDSLYTNYQFKGWTNIDLSTTPITKLTLTKSNNEDTVKAIWVGTAILHITYRVKFDYNGGTKNYDDWEDLVQEDNNVFIIPNKRTPAKLGHNFVEWNTKADGTGTSYTTNQTLTLSNETVTLYAIYSIKKFTVTWKLYHEDIEASDANRTLKTQTNVAYGTAISSLTFPETPTRENHDFKNWSHPTSTVTTVTLDLTIYAVWTGFIFVVGYATSAGTATRPAKAHVRYEGNSDNQLSYSYTVVANDSSNGPGFTRSGYTWKGWSKVAEGQSGYKIDYTGGETITIGQLGITLYAYWVQDEPDVEPTPEMKYKHYLSFSSGLENNQLTLDSTPVEELVFPAGSLWGNTSQCVWTLPQCTWVCRDDEDGNRVLFTGWKLGDNTIKQPGELFTVNAVNGTNSITTVNVTASAGQTVTRTSVVATWSKQTNPCTIYYNGIGTTPASITKHVPLGENALASPSSLGMVRSDEKIFDGWFTTFQNGEYSNPVGGYTFTAEGLSLTVFAKWS